MDFSYDGELGFEIPVSIEAGKDCRPAGPDWIHPLSGCLVEVIHSVRYYQKYEKLACKSWLLCLNTTGRAAPGRVAKLTVTISHHSSQWKEIWFSHCLETFPISSCRFSVVAGSIYQLSLRQVSSSRLYRRCFKIVEEQTDFTLFYNIVFSQWLYSDDVSTSHLPRPFILQLNWENCLCKRDSKTNIFCSHPTIVVLAYKHSGAMVFILIIIIIIICGLI